MTCLLPGYELVEDFGELDRAKVGRTVVTTRARLLRSQNGLRFAVGLKRSGWLSSQSCEFHLPTDHSNVEPVLHSFRSALAVIDSDRAALMAARPYSPPFARLFRLIGCTWEHEVEGFPNPVYPGRLPWRVFVATVHNHRHVVLQTAATQPRFSDYFFLPSGGAVAVYTLLMQHRT